MKAHTIDFFPPQVEDDLLSADVILLSESSSMQLLDKGERQGLSSSISLRDADLFNHSYLHSGIND